ncbi:MAG TPA: exodeoxyribonuclease VII small subunit [Sphaerochaeta sp.]|jgi:exodeoxyribonuclease VII small subunit|nr:exodeoxyribonuclease VII small subunit [Sphaerochaeta sp.]HPZ15240.1 exodeoxyribonuclease VII small subunit [Sphaerochaeta sp.]
MSFEEDIKKVEEIAQKLSSSQTPLEEAITLFEEGMALTKALEKTLSDAKRTVELVRGEAIDSVEITTLE